MDTGKGLTVVPHEDLVSAVDNWHTLCELFNTVTSNAYKHAELCWANKNLFYRIWCQVKSGMFQPDEWWEGYGEYLEENKITGFLIGKDWLSDYSYINAMAAEDCAKHVLENGTHYLSPRQVQFVHVFKNLKVK